MVEGCLVDFCSWLNASFCDPVVRHARSRGDINRHSSARGNPPVTEGMLIETIDPDFLIKALNKKIRADCLIKENAPEPVVTSAAGSIHQGVQQGPRALDNSRIRGPNLYALAYTRSRRLKQRVSSAGK